MKEEINEENVTIEKLNEVDYKDLKVTFEKLGVVECWKPGIKKTTLCEKAFNTIQEKKKLKKIGLSEEEIKKEIEKKEILDIEIKEKEEIQLEKQKEIDQEKKVDELVEKKMSKEDIVKNIEIVNLNLISANPTLKKILLIKKKTLQLALSKL